MVSFAVAGLAPIFRSAATLETQSFEAFAGLQAEGTVVPFSIPMHWET